MPTIRVKSLHTAIGLNCVFLKVIIAMAISGCVNSPVTENQENIASNSTPSASDVKQTVQDARGAIWEIRRAAEEVKSLMNGF
jgi:hypothetical protein